MILACIRAPVGVQDPASVSIVSSWDARAISLEIHGLNSLPRHTHFAIGANHTTHTQSNVKT